MIITEYSGTITDVVVDEAAYQTATGFSTDTISDYKYDGADWVDLGTSATVDMATLGITFDGTATLDDEIIVAFHPSAMLLFSAGDGVNCIKLNTNFDQLKTNVNTNETAINNIESTALLADGSNLSQSVINQFQQQTPTILSTSGTIALADGTMNFLTLTGNGTISLPTITPDQYAHNIMLVVEGGAYSLDLGTVKHLYNPLAVDTTQTYNVMYLYNKIDGDWYYSLTQ